MNTLLLQESTGTDDCFELLAPGHAGSETQDNIATTKTILLVSDDTGFGRKLRSAAYAGGMELTQVGGMADTLRAVRNQAPSVVLLDLDLPADAGWDAVDALLQEENRPPIILLTARTGQIDVSDAVTAGSLVAKSVDSAVLMELVEQTLVAPDSVKADRDSVQQVAIRWLKPYAWSVPLTPGNRFWGINE